MGEMNFTQQQASAAYTRNKNLLVSAAAGSGKTAVLVERIISMISKGDHPIDIDHLLVVTFTNAAAAQMRGKIEKAINKKLEADPENQHLQKQMSLIQSAQITTIHSFCLNVIRNYFHRIDLDPSFKIAEESEITLMKSDVIAEVLERWYEEGKEEFHAFIESYSYSKSDTPIEELILQLYNFSMSDPWPRLWIAKKLKMFEVNSMEEMINAPWMNEIVHYVNVVLGDLLNKNKQALEVCNEEDGPKAYSVALNSDLSLLNTLKAAETYENYSKLFTGIAYDRLSSKKEEGVSPWKKDRVKELREEVKKGIKDLTNQYFFQTPEEMLADLQAVAPLMKVLFDLTLEFMEEFAKKKEEKNLIDFNDLEHFALKILVKENEEEKEPGRTLPTEAALELSELFEEILIDEYQDSNMVQETILRSISREELGKPNRFMVGDVKQSIYKFRLAMPEIFMEKYETYSIGELNEEGCTNLFQRIDLDKNFRSRKSVLEYVNQVFEQIMQKPVGGIIYDEAASLKYGELFEDKLGASDRSDEVQTRIAKEVELLLVTEEDTESTQEEGNAPDPSREQITKEDPEEAVYTKKDLEVRAIAKRIRALTDPESGMLVCDEETKLHRPATYKDIVILLRSMSNWSEVFVNSLMEEGIPAYADTGTGYFQTLEIITVLNMLRIIDNPRQDIPLVGILYSPIVGLTTTELAQIRAASRNTSMYAAAFNYAIEGSEELLKSKLVQFLEQLDGFRAEVNYKPIHELIQLILDQTGYYYYACAMPGGDRRKGNIEMLISQAVRFEKGSYSGLFHFIRYIEKLHKYEVDFGEAATAGEKDDTVRIMSIHKSKGLEFPIVIVAGMSKQFNNQDLRSSIVLHSELGVGPEYVDSKLRTKIPTLLKKAIQKKVQIENLGEELRVLYVAMTRAKEKLILSGYMKSKDEIKQKAFSFFELLSAKSYLDWVLPAMVNRMGSLPSLDSDSLLWTGEGMTISVIPKKELLLKEQGRQISRFIDQSEILAINMEQIYDPGLREEVKTRINYEYPYKKEAGLKVKMTVSELKKLGQYIEEEQSVNLFPKIEEMMNIGEMDPHLDRSSEQYLGKDIEQKAEQTLPAFLREKEEVVTGTDRGTLYHKVLELIDLTRIKNRDDFNLELERLVKKKLIGETDVRMLKQDLIFRFTTSKVAKRMQAAGKLGKLYKEKQFVIGIKANEVMKDIDSEELILIQGIIDVFFEEEGELVLLDYKSDLVLNERQLVNRYKVQLDYYRKALEQMMCKKVKEMIIYSLPLGKEIRIEE